METNTLYLLIAFLLALVIGIALFKSDILKVKATKDGLDLEAGKNPEKDYTRIKNVINQSEVEVTQKDGHHVAIEDIDGSTVKVKK